MTTSILKILMTVFCIQVLIKFYVFFFVKYDTRRIQPDKAYRNKTTATKVSDYVLLAVIKVSFLYLHEMQTIY